MSPKRIERSVPSAPSRRPEVTVLVPAYNYARYLPECAASVLSQRDVDVRLVIVDDCSTDDTPAVTAQLAADPRVTVVRNEPNAGHIPSVNRGMAMIETEYAVKLDADDLLAPGALARGVALLERHPEVSFAYGRPEHFEGATPAPVDGKTRSWSLWSGRDWVARRCHTAVNAISQPEVVIRTSFLKRALPIREDLPHTSDLHFWMQLASMGDVGRVNGPVQGYYRVHDQSMQRTTNSGTYFDLRARRDAFDALFAGVGGDLPDAPALHARARRSLAGAGLDRAARAYERGRTATEPVDEFVAFALESCPDVRSLPEWVALQRRIAAGTERAQRDPRFLSVLVARRALEETSRLRWIRTGEIGPLRWQHLLTR
jgi:hypothetical protein